MQKYWQKQLVLRMQQDYIYPSVNHTERVRVELNKL